MKKPNSILEFANYCLLKLAPSKVNSGLHLFILFTHYEPRLLQNSTYNLATQNRRQDLFSTRKEFRPTKEEVRKDRIFRATSSEIESASSG